MCKALFLGILTLLLAPSWLGGRPASAQSNFLVNSELDMVDATPGDGVCAAANGECTLRGAIQESNALPGDDDIELPSGNYPLTIAGAGESFGATGDLNIRDDLTLTGAGAGSTVVDAAAIDRVISVETQDKHVTIAGVTIQNGNSGFEGGGGIRSEDTVLEIRDSLVRWNSTGWVGGALEIEDGVLLLVGDAIVHNAAGFGGGGIAGDGTIYIQNSTISLNEALTGGAILNEGGTALVSYATIAYNESLDSAIQSGFEPSIAIGNSILANNSPANCQYVVPSAGHNLITDDSCEQSIPSDIVGTDAGIGPLRDNGGGTPTHQLLAGSPAIDAAQNSVCPIQDQRGADRPAGTACDIGAYEAPAGTPAGAGRSLSPAHSFLVNTTSDGTDVAPGDGACVTAGGTCSLRASVQETNALAGADEILLPAGIYALTVPGTNEYAAASGDLNILDDLTLTGAGADETVVDAAGIDRALSVFGLGKGVSISGITVQNGVIAGGGAGIVLSLASLSLQSVVVRGNTATATRGGGIFSDTGTLLVSGSSIIDNAAAIGGGLTVSGGVASIVNSTISRNQALIGGAVGGGDGSFIFSSTIAFNTADDSAIESFVTDFPVLSDTILAGNSPANCGHVSSVGHNVFSDGSCNAMASATDVTGVDARITPLEDHGGRTPTHALLNDSPAIDAAAPALCPILDQRGIERPQGNECDIGSYEREPATIGALADYVAELPSSNFKSAGTQVAMVAILGAAEKEVAQGEYTFASSKLDRLRGRVDGCGVEPDHNDWIVDFATQLTVRVMLNEVVSGLDR